MKATPQTSNNERLSASLVKRQNRSCRWWQRWRPLQGEGIKVTPVCGVVLMVVVEHRPQFPTGCRTKSPSVRVNQWGPPDTSQTPGKGGGHVMPRQGDGSGVRGGAVRCHGSNRENMDAPIPVLGDKHVVCLWFFMCLTIYILFKNGIGLVVWAHDRQTDYILSVCLSVMCPYIYFVYVWAEYSNPGYWYWRS